MSGEPCGVNVPLFLIGVAIQQLNLGVTGLVWDRERGWGVVQGGGVQGGGVQGTWGPTRAGGL